MQIFSDLNLFELRLHEFFRSDFFVRYHPLAQAVKCSGQEILRDCIRAAQLPLDCEKIAFPHQALSAAHTDGCALGVCVRNSHYKGVGIDLEKVTRKISAKTLPGYCSLAEQKRLKLTTEDRLRLWVVKEAIFKADDQNSGRVLRNYSVNELADQGSATCDLDTAEFSYLSGRWTDYLIAVAVKV